MVVSGLCNDKKYEHIEFLCAKSNTYLADYSQSMVHRPLMGPRPFQAMHEVKTSFIITQGYIYLFHCVEICWCKSNGRQHDWRLTQTKAVAPLAVIVFFTTVH